MENFFHSISHEVKINSCHIYVIDSTGGCARRAKMEDVSIPLRHVTYQRIQTEKDVGIACKIKAYVKDVNFSNER